MEIDADGCGGGVNVSFLGETGVGASWIGCGLEIDADGCAIGVIDSGVKADFKNGWRIELWRWTGNLLCMVLIGVGTNGARGDIGEAGEVGVAGVGELMEEVVDDGGELFNLGSNPGRPVNGGGGASSSICAIGIVVVVGGGGGGRSVSSGGGGGAASWKSGGGGGKP